MKLLGNIILFIISMFFTQCNKDCSDGDLIDPSCDKDYSLVSNTKYIMHYGPKKTFDRPFVINSDSAFMAIYNQDPALLNEKFDVDFNVNSVVGMFSITRGYGSD